MKRPKILVVDDDQNILHLFNEILEAFGFEVLTASSGSQALELMTQISFQLMLLDLVMPGMDGLETLKKAEKLGANFPIILITAYGDIRSAVEAMRLGAWDYITKPVETAELIATINKALELQGVKDKERGLDPLPRSKESIFELMGNSDQVKRLAEAIQKVAPTDYSVIIQGETGTGKELVAKAIHYSSPRAQNPFIPLDCSAVPETLIESELFGYKRGAFTGADKNTEGYFQMAHSGTIFLDEINNLSEAVQTKLLRTLQEREIVPLGEKQSIRVNVRIIAASNTILEEQAQKGYFRLDLFHRLNEFTINIPPLRERIEDIPFLANRFLDEAKEALQKDISGFSEEVLTCLYQYDYPGNVRELRNIVRRATLLAEDIIDTQHLALPGNYIEDEKDYVLYPIKSEAYSLKETVKKTTQEVEIKLIREVLSFTKGNLTKAAKILKVDYKTLRYKIKSYGIMVKEFLP